MNASGKRISRAPWAAASAVRRHVFSTVASRSKRTGAACTTATRTMTDHRTWLLFLMGPTRRICNSSGDDLRPLRRLDTRSGWSTPSPVFPTRQAALDQPHAARLADSDPVSEPEPTLHVEDQLHPMRRLALRSRSFAAGTCTTAGPPVSSNGGGPGPAMQSIVAVRRTRPRPGSTRWPSRTPTPPRQGEAAGSRPAEQANGRRDVRPPPPANTTATASRRCPRGPPDAARTRIDPDKTGPTFPAMRTTFPTSIIGLWTRHVARPMPWRTAHAGSSAKCPPAEAIDMVERSCACMRSRISRSVSFEEGESLATRRIRSGPGLPDASRSWRRNTASPPPRFLAKRIDPMGRTHPVPVHD